MNIRLNSGSFIQSSFRLIFRGNLLNSCKLFKVFILMILLATTNSILADTYVSGGIISSDSTWTSSGSPYIIQGKIYIYSGGNLSIDPGTVIQFDSGAGIQIGDAWNSTGGLHAQGSVGNEIIFTSSSGLTDGWDGLFFNRGSGDTLGVTSVLDYCIIENAGQGGYYGQPTNILCSYTNQPTITNSIIRNAVDGMYIDNSDPGLSGCTLQENSRYGIHCASGSPLITNCNFVLNTDFPVYAIPGAAPTGSGNTYLNNGYDFIGMQGGAYGGDIIIKPMDIPYLLLTDFVFSNNTIYQTNHLTIMPGVTMVCDSGVGIQINPGGSYPVEFIAEGTQDSAITFTSLSGIPNGWDGLKLRGTAMTAASSMRHCIIENAGQDGWGQNANVYYEGAHYPSMDSCIIRNSGYDGVYLESTSSPLITASTIELNDRDGIVMGNASPTINNCVLQMNGEYPIHMDVNSSPANTNNMYSNNGIEGIAVDGGQLDWGRHITWYNDSPEPILVLAAINITNLSIMTHPSLTIMPGVTVAFTNTSSLNIAAGSYYGELSANGLPDSQITFTSWSGESGGWPGLRFADAASGSLNHCIIKNAGFNLSDVSAGIYSHGANNVSMEDCEIIHSEGNGLHLDGSSWHPKRSIFIYCDSIGILCTGSASPIIGDTLGLGCWFYGNEVYNVANITSSTIGAKHNYWGSADSQLIAESIFDQTDSLAFGIVEFIPTGIPNHDARVVEILAPDSIIYDYQTIVPQAIVRNTGAAEDTIPVYIEIIEIDSTFRDSTNVILMPGDSDVVSFSSWQPQVLGVDTVRCFAALPSDEFNHNDTITNPFAVAQDPNAPVITELIPNSGGNTGSIVFHIIGTNFDSGMNLILTNGVDSIILDSAKIYYVDPDTLLTMLDLNGLSTGNWDVIVYSSEGASGYFMEGFHIEEGYEDLWVEIIGPEDTRGGRPSTYSVYYGNDGNVDVFYQYVILAYSSSLEHDVNCLWFDPFENTNDIAKLNTDYNFVACELGRMQSGSYGSNKISFTPPIDLFSFELYVDFVNDPYEIYQDIAALPNDIWDVIIPHPDTSGNIKESVITVDNELDNNDCDTYPYQDCSLNPPAGYIMLWEPSIDPSGNTTDFTYYDPQGNPISHKADGLNFHMAVSLGNGQFAEVFSNGLYIGAIDPRNINANSGYKCATRPLIECNEMEAYGALINLRTQAIYSQWGPYGSGNCVYTKGGSLCASEANSDILKTNCIGLIHILNPHFQQHSAYGRHEILQYCSMGHIGYFLSNFDFLQNLGNNISNLLGFDLGGSVDPACFNGINDAQGFIISVLGSRDPNDKFGSPGFGDSRYVLPNKKMNYVVQFQNIPTATLMSDTIWIVDTLSEYLDFATFQWGEIYPGNGPDSIRPYFVVDTVFDAENGIAYWGLYDINLPPDTALFEGTDSVQYWGEGWVSYSIDLLHDLPTGTRIENLAYIKFDVNDWIAAPMDSIPIFNTIDNGFPKCSVLTLPDTTESLNFMVHWAGADDSAGSGIGSYTIYYSDNEGPYEIWLGDTIADFAEFTGEHEHTYAFYSISRDNVGHIEAPPDSFDAKTTVWYEYTCADVNCDDIINIFDITYLISFLYLDGPDPCNMDAADLNGRDGLVNIFDVTYLISFLYLEGPPPDCMGSDKTFASVKTTPKSDSALIVCSTKEGRSVIEINSPEEIFGIEMNLKSKEGNSIILKSLIDDIKAYYSQDGDIIRLGMVDAKGQKFIPKGKTEVIEIDGEVEILSILAADKSSQPVPFKFNNIILPREFSLDQNYPNPFNPTTTIKFALPKSSSVNLEIYNILGRKVTTLINDQLDAGFHTVKWNSTDSEGREVATGVYFYRLKAGDFVKSKKMLLLK